MNLRSLHHVAIICSDYARSKAFYTGTLSLGIISEIYRPERHSYKLNLAVPGGGEIELFSFPSPPPRPTRPEARGLRHLAFSVDHLDEQVDELVANGIPVEPVRIDEITGQRFTFFSDPDGLPIELYETKK
jgi:glyoxylase I family protein